MNVARHSDDNNKNKILAGKLCWDADDCEKSPAASTHRKSWWHSAPTGDFCARKWPVFVTEDNLSCLPHVTLRYHTAITTCHASLSCRSRRPSFPDRLCSTKSYVEHTSDRYHPERDTVRFKVTFRYHFLLTKRAFWEAYNFLLCEIKNIKNRNHDLEQKLARVTTDFLSPTDISFSADIPMSDQKILR